MSMLSNHRGVLRRFWEPIDSHYASIPALFLLLAGIKIVRS